MKGYKVFNSDMKCLGFQYEVGKTFFHDGEIELCKSGFHFCAKIEQCFDYYKFEPKNIVCEVEPIGKILGSSEDKMVTNKIHIIRQLSWGEVLELVNIGSGNSGYYNSGNCNSGNYNSGNHNSGYRNSGNHNSGYRNSGNYNSGDCNSGNYNSGNCNSGNYNSGNHNSGYRNSGDYNSGNYNSGLFCTDKDSKIKIFDIDSNMTIKNWRESQLAEVIQKNLVLNKWIVYEKLSQEEKEKYPSGYLKTFTYKEAWSNLWNNISVEEKQLFYELPNFNADKFEEITGIKITD